MAIKIIEDENDVVLTREEHDRLQDEYSKCMAYYAGPKISFETWVRNRQKDDSLARMTRLLKGWE
jgi:hypothetical protein